MAESPVTPKAPLRELFAYARPHRVALAVGFVLALGSSAAGLVQPLAAKLVIDTLGTGASVVGPVVALGAVVLVGAALSGLYTWMLDRTAERAVLGVRRDLATRLVRLRVSVLDRQAPGDLVTRLTADSTLLRSAVTNNLVELCTGALALVGAIVFMATLEPRLLAMTLAMLGFVALVVGVILPRIRAAMTRSQEAVGEIGSVLDRVLGAIRTVKASGTEERETAAVHTAARTAYDAGLSAARFGSLVAAITPLAIEVPFLGVLGIGGAMVAKGALELGTLIAFLLFLFYLAEPVGNLVSGFTGLQAGLAAVSRIRGVRELPVEDDVDAEPGADVRADARADVRAQRPPELALDGISFGYGDGRLALDDVSVRAPAGRTTAIVGPSGAGKSTLFGLLLRFYEPDSGTIRLDGADVTGVRRSVLRRRIGYVEQDAPAMDGTLEDNLRYAAPDADDADLREVLAATRLDDLVARLPGGLDTRVGPRGVTLSGGERQRVAIARALLRRPEVLLLDEATSQLDARNELALRTALSAAASRCTVLVIAHRLSTVTEADQLVVLDSGRVRAIGAHEELLARDDLYRELATTQLLAREPE